jgi:hypothetical protein
MPVRINNTYTTRKPNSTNVLLSANATPPSCSSDHPPKQF